MLESVAGHTGIIHLRKEAKNQDTTGQEGLQ